MIVRTVAFAVIVLASAAPAPAQTMPMRAEPEQPQPIVEPTVVAGTVDTGAGRVGQRQSRDELARTTNGQPLARIESRIDNRIQSRLRNRLDQNYDPTANATSPFKVAEERSIRVGQRR